MKHLQRCPRLSVCAWKGRRCKLSATDTREQKALRPKRTQSTVPLSPRLPNPDSVQVRLCRVLYRSFGSFSIKCIPSPNIAGHEIDERYRSHQGPKGRTLLGTGKNTNARPKDYSEATLRPAEATQGKKLETDTCLTCIKYGRICRGTDMKFVKTQRAGGTSQ